MQLKDLPQEIQDKLRNERMQLYKTMHIDNAYCLCLVNKGGTRYFSAHRKQHASLWLPFGGGSYWVVAFGVIRWRKRHDSLSGDVYEWVMSDRYSQSANGTEIPEVIQTKKEVIDIAKRIGIFDLK